MPTNKAPDLSYIVNRTRVAHIVNHDLMPSPGELRLMQHTRIAYALCSNYSYICEHTVKGQPLKHTDHGVKPCLSCEKAARKRGLFNAQES